MDSRFYRSSGVSSAAVMPTIPNTAAQGVPSNIAASANSWKGELADVTQGRITLAALEALIILMVVFYWKTHGIQGGG